MNDNPGWKAGTWVVWRATGTRGRVVEDRAADQFVMVQPENCSDWEWAAPSEIRPLSVVEMIGELEG